MMVLDHDHTGPVDVNSHAANVGPTRVLSERITTHEVDQKVGARQFELIGEEHQ